MPSPGIRKYLNEWKLRNCHEAYRVLSTALYMSISSIIPAITFASFLISTTNSQYGTIEVLFSTGLSGVIYVLTAGQPLVIVGVTGPIAVFSRSIYQLALVNNLQFLPFMFWIGAWTCMIHLVIGSFKLSSRAIAFVSRFTCETFGALIAAVYVFTAVDQLAQGFRDMSLASSLLALILAAGTYLIASWLSGIRYSSLYNKAFRTLVSDYGLILSLVIMSAIPALLPLNAENIQLDTLAVSSSFIPSNGRSQWFVDPLSNPAWSVFAAIPAAMLLTVLIFFDHNVASMLAQDGRYFLKKLPSYDRDFVVIGLTILLTSALGLPPAHGLLPQAPLHTMRLSIIKEDVTFDMDTKQHSIKYVYSDVLEQRVSNFLQSMITLCLIFIPAILGILGHIPVAVLSGVFLILGYESVQGNTFVERAFVMLFVSDHNLRSKAAPNCWPDLDKFISTESTDRHRMRQKINIFTGIQLMFLVTVFLVMEVAPSYVSLTFPVFIVLMVAVPFVLKSGKLRSRAFTQRELDVLENSNQVPASDNDLFGDDDMEIVSIELQESVE